jgi:hypothetical protein
MIAPICLSYIRRRLFVLVLLTLLAAGCAGLHPAPHNSPETADLLVIRHSPDHEYLVMVYRHPGGAKRLVVRRSGICEFIVTQSPDGSVRLKVRGERERVIGNAEANELALRIESLLQKEGDFTATSI